MLSSTFCGADVSQEEQPAPHQWLFSKEEMKMSANRKDGMSYEEELTWRQRAASFIQDIVECLNKNVHDQRCRINQLGMCVANIHMNRFFYWHSFKKFDYKDVATACLFLSGKSEESPRKLSHVVEVWRQQKGLKPMSPDHKAEAAQYIVTLESCILQTIAFDLNVDLPHSHVIRIMNRFELNGSVRKRTTAAAYYFSTDVLCVMDWSIRYSCLSIAVAVVHMVSIYADFNIESFFPPETAKQWFVEYDPDMTEEILKEMETDFMKVYAACSNFHWASNITFKTKQSEESNNVVQAKRPDSRNESSPRILPDSSVDSTTGKRYDRRDDNRQRDRGYGSALRDDQTAERLHRERMLEEERRKREGDRITGRSDNSSISEKRARIDPLSNNFVSSSTNGSSNALKGLQSVTSASSTAKKVSNGDSPVQSRFDSSTPLTPPPNPPNMHSASSSDMDLEDGELE